MERYREARNRLFSMLDVGGNSKMNNQELQTHLHTTHNVPKDIVGDRADMEAAHNLDHNLGNYSHTHKA